MKKTIVKTFIFISLLTSLLTACQSTKQSDQISADSYDNTEEIVKIETKESTTSEDKSRYNTTKPKKTTIEKIFTYGNKNKFVSNDETTLFTKNLGAGISQRRANIMINPEAGTAGFGSVYLAAYYIMQYNPENYDKIAKAYAQYLDDFENKKLERKGKNTYKKYGSIQVHYDWGTIKSSTPNYGNGTAYLGYEFVKNSPYFMISSYPIKNDYYDLAGDAVSKNSIQLTYYFTKSQIQDLLNMTSEESVENFMETYTSDEIFDKENADSYGD